MATIRRRATTGDGSTVDKSPILTPEQSPETPEVHTVATVESSLESRFFGLLILLKFTVAYKAFVVEVLGSHFPLFQMSNITVDIKDFGPLNCRILQSMDGSGLKIV